MKGANMKGANMEGAKLKRILFEHAVWLQSGGKKGVRADLRGATMIDADLRDANLRGADLHAADLKGADLRDANLKGVDLRAADLKGADLRGATMVAADLRGADLKGADLRGATMDYSSWPIWCGSLGVKVDKKIAIQFLYHALDAMQSVDDEECREVLKDEKILALANQFHRSECERIGGGENNAHQ